MIKFHPNERATIQDLLQEKCFDSTRNQKIEELPGVEIDLKMDFYPESRSGAKCEFTIKSLKKYLKKMIKSYF